MSDSFDFIQALKIKKLLGETIEFSQKTVNIAAAHRKSQMTGEHGGHTSSMQGGRAPPEGMIRDLIGGGRSNANDQLRLNANSTEGKGFKQNQNDSLSGGQGFRVVEHSDQQSEGSNLTQYDLGSSEINKAVHDILKARKLLAKHA